MHFQNEQYTWMTADHPVQARAVEKEPCIFWCRCGGWWHANHPWCWAIPNANSHPYQYGGFLPSTGNCSWHLNKCYPYQCRGGWVPQALQKKSSGQPLMTPEAIQHMAATDRTPTVLSRSEQATRLQVENRPQLKHERPHLYPDWNWLNQNSVLPATWQHLLQVWLLHNLWQRFWRVTRKLDSSLDDHSKQQPSSTGSVSIWVTKRWTAHTILAAKHPNQISGTGLADHRH